ncbi:GNAT family N-acetyltransferase [Deinococcus detaillensis]|uniref:GNAT family N-acetyltransferase n=1 Tax=Deinococcus detaillensis TaxID=2592048 RepID=A0A553V656_9DEIO|nr:GNAT family N-acetyltransferase [Deinococcus detaillensis]TSA87948.1 GNAT family N-acetyltransferase [Deinococcus detaillensis]
MSLSVRRVTDPHDPALEAFGRIQEAAYYQPEMLIPAEYFGPMIAQPPQTSQRQNIILVAEQGGEVVGGTLFHLLSSGAGFSSFMGVAQSAWGTGAARALHQARMQIIGEAGAAGVFADAVHRQALSAEDLAAEARVGSDPTLRRVKLGALGFFTVDIPYWQPVGGPEGGPLKDLDLMYCPLETSETVSLRLVTDTMQAYWQGWLGADRAAKEAGALAQRTGQNPTGQSSVALLSATERPKAFSQS